MDDTTDIPTIPVDAQGRIYWRRSPAFVAWARKHAPSMTNDELCTALSKKLNREVAIMNVGHMRRALRIKMSADTVDRAYAQRKNCEPSVTKLLLLGPADKERFVAVTGDTLVTSDWHVPHHDEDLVGRMLAVAKRLGIRQLIINGDFLNEDAFSRWKSHPFNVDWKTEKAIAKALLQRLITAFDRIYYILDNHDRRIIARHERPSEFDETDLLDILLDATTRGVVRASIFYHMCIVNNTWRVTSPREYRRQKLSLPSRLAQLYHMNIISGGDHLFGLGVDDSARYVVANNCCMVNREEVPYVMTQDSAYPWWSPGFYAIVNNVLHPFVAHEGLWPTWWEHLNAKAWRMAPVRRQAARMRRKKA